MPVLVVYAVLAVTPAAALLAAGTALDRWCRRHPRRRSAAPAGRPLEQLTHDLRRLERDYRRISGSDLPGRVGRMRTVALAYDDTLRACCRAVGLPEPQDPLDGLARLETEAALTQPGCTGDRAVSGRDGVGRRHRVAPCPPLPCPRTRWGWRSGSGSTRCSPTRGGATRSRRSARAPPASSGGCTGTAGLPGWRTRQR